MFWNKKKKASSNPRSEIKKYLDKKGDPKTICALYLKIFREDYKLNLTVKSIRYDKETGMLSIKFNERIEMSSNVWNTFKNTIEPDLKKSISGYDQFMPRTDEKGTDTFVIHKAIDFEETDRLIADLQDRYNRASPAEKARMNQKAGEILRSTRR